MTTTIRSQDLTPGTVLIDKRRNTPTDHVRTVLTERKTDDTGWWCAHLNDDGERIEASGGWGDFVLDSCLARGTVVLETAPPALPVDGAVFLRMKDVPATGWEVRNWEDADEWRSWKSLQGYCDQNAVVEARPLRKTSTCVHCGRSIYPGATETSWYHYATKTKLCDIPRPFATPVEDQR